MANRVRRTIKRIATGVGVAVACLAAYLTYIHKTGNFDTLVPGEVFRSAQVVTQICLTIASNMASNPCSIFGGPHQTADGTPQKSPKVTGWHWCMQILQCRRQSASRQIRCLN